MRPAFSKTLMAALIALWLLAISAALAQEPAADRGPNPRERERIQSVIIGKFATEMDLTPEQAEKFFPRLRQFQDRMEAAQRDDRAARMQLEQMSQNQDANPADLNSLLDKRKIADQSVAQMKQEFLSDISGFLTTQQVSRCSILIDEIPRQMREFMRAKERERMHEGNSPSRENDARRQGRRGY